MNLHRAARHLATALMLLPLLMLGGCRSEPILQTPVAAPLPPRVALVLGGGAARGFAHVGVIKMLESQGIVPDLIVGTSAGSVVGALYASGLNGFQLQEMTFDLDRKAFADWHWFGRGLLKGQALQDYVNKAVGGVRIEQLKKPFACVAAKLRTGEPVLFTTGDVGLAVRASSAIPGIFEPPVIDGEEYVDGGTVSPVPVRFAQALGAQVVIAVNVSASIDEEGDDSTLKSVLKTFNIMGHALSAAELPLADVVITPDVRDVGSADFDSKQRSILQGERAALAAVPAIKAAIAAKTVAR
jgi:NTE family protein